MLAGCVPVVMDVTAMPEVVGDAGVLIESQQPEAVADGVRRAFELGPDASRRARERILDGLSAAAAARRPARGGRRGPRGAACGGGIVRPPSPVEDGCLPHA